MKRKKSFSLAEFMVVILILAILVLLSGIAGQKYMKAGRNTSRMNDINQLTQSIQGFYITNFLYPSPGNAIKIIDSSGLIGILGSQGVFDNSAKSFGVPITKTPTDPYDNSYYTYTKIDIGPKGFEIGGSLEKDDFYNSIPFVNTNYTGNQKMVYMQNQYNTGDFGIFPLPYLTTMYSGTYLNLTVLGDGGAIYINLKTRTVSSLSGTLAASINTGNIEILAKDKY